MTNIMSGTIDQVRLEELRILADSVNDTSRMARTSLMLVLIVSMYLMLTLVTATDENLLRNSVVTLPQTNTGISIAQSYIFAPPIFFYLHLQTLLLLSVLARKLSRFQRLLNARFSTASKNQNQEMCRDWLSAFSFVQQFSTDRDISRMAKVLVWLSTVFVPLTLLVMIDISFLRYQSPVVTLSHHALILADILAVVWFSRQRSALKQSINRDPGSSSISKNGRNRYWMSLGQRLMAYCSIVPLTIFLQQTFPSHQDINLDIRIPGTNFLLQTSNVLKYGVENNNGESQLNLYDVYLCSSILEWTGVCRYLNVSNQIVIDPRAISDRDVLLNLIGIENTAEYSRMLFGINLRNRSLRFANFSKSILRGAQLQFADLTDADLECARVNHADLQGVDLIRATLMYTDLSDADVFSTDFKEAILSGVNVSGVGLDEAEGLEESDVGGFCGDERTKYPSAFKSPPLNCNPSPTKCVTY